MGYCLQATLSHPQPPRVLSKGSVKVWGWGRLAKRKHPEKKNVSWRGRSQGDISERILAFRDRKHLHGGHPGVAEPDRTPGLPDGLTGLPRQSFG